MSDDLRDALREGIATLFVEGEDSYHAADAVLAMPEIVDMVALKRVVNGLTVEQVARALGHASSSLDTNQTEWAWVLDADELAVVAWEEPT